MRIRIDASTILPGRSAGVEAFAYGLLGGLTAATEHDVEAMIIRGTSSDWRKHVNREVQWSEVRPPILTGDGLGHRLRRVLPHRVQSSYLARRTIAALRDRRRPSYGDDPDITLYPFHRVPARAARSVVTVHDLRTFQRRFRSPADIETVRQNVARASAIVVSWPHPHQQVLDTFPEARWKTALIPLPTFHPQPTNLKLATDPTLLLYPSSTSSHKNHVNLVDAMSFLPEFRLVCPGPLVEPQAAALAKRVASSGLRNRVHFPGFVTVAELQALLAQATAIVVPSMWEAASGAIFEAFSWGIPVACADVEPLRSQVEFAGGEACFFSPTDPQSVANAIRRVVADHDRYAAASRRAGQRLGARTWVDTARDYTAVFEWVVRGCIGPIPRSSFFSAEVEQ